MAALLLSFGFTPALAGKPVAWLRIMSQSDEKNPNNKSTQDFNPQRGWGYRDYHNDRDCQELAKQMARAGIKTVLLDQTSFGSNSFADYYSNRETVLHGNIIAGIKTQEAAYRNGMTAAVVTGFDQEGGFSNDEWAEANECAGIFWNENVSRPGYEYAADGKPLFVIFMRPDKAIAWQAFYATLPAQYRTHLDRFHIEVAGHRITDGYPMFGWRPANVTNVTWGDDRCRAITAISNFTGTACSAAEWARRTDVALQASEYSTFCSYTDAESGSWGIMNYLGLGYYASTTNTLFISPGNDPMAYYAILAKKTGGVASTFNEAVYDYGVRGIFATSADIGSPALAGDALHWNCIYNLSGAGSGLGGTSDQFRYLYKPWTTNGTLVARIDQLGGPDAQSRAGVMARAGTNANAPFVFIGPKTNNTLSFSVRSTAGAASQEQTVAGISPPCWVRLTRINDLFAADYSTNGLDWVQAGTQTVSDISLAGLAVCSGTARLSNVSETFTAPAVEAFNPAAYSVLFTQGFDALGVLSPGAAYTTAALTADRSINAGLVSAVSGTFANGEFPATSLAVVAPGNAGISPGQPNGFENQIAWAQRVGPGFEIKTAASGKVFRAAYAEIVVSGVVAEGFQASVGYQLPDNSINYLHFNNGRPMTNGTYRVNLLPENLIWTDAATPLISGSRNFKILLTDPGTETGATDGILQSLKVYAETGPFTTAPTALTAVPGNGSVQLDWAGSSPAGWRVYRKMPGSFSPSRMATVSNSDFIDDTAFNGIAYDYVVRAVDASGKESDNSNIVTVTPTESVPPAAPTMLAAAEEESGFIKLDWADNAEEDLGGYNVYRLTSDTYVLIASNVTRSVYLDQFADTGITNHYRVTAFDRLGNESAFAESLDPYGLWAAGYNLSGSQTNGTSDTDNDGLVNLLEYAFGGNPTNDDAAAMNPAAQLVAAGGTNVLEYVYRRRTDDPSLTYGILLADDLLASPSWTNVGTAYETAPTGATENPGVESVTNRIPTTEAQKFIRLEVGGH